MTDTSELLTVSQAAEALSASSQTVRNWIRSGRVEGVRIGHRFLIHHDEVERLRRGTSATGEGPWALDADVGPVRLPRAGAIEGEPFDLLGA